MFTKSIPWRQVYPALWVLSYVQSYDRAETVLAFHLMGKLNVSASTCYWFSTGCCSYLKLYRRPKSTLLGGIGIKPDSM